MVEIMRQKQERPFNLDLLKQPTKAKLQYFRDVIVPHRNIKQILDLLLKNAIEPDDASVYLVFGVTGVGKTRLMQEFQKRLVKHFMDELIENPGSLIVGGIEVDSAEGGKFNYSDYYIQVLEALREVLIDYKITYDIDSAEQSDADALLGTFESKNSKALRRAMQKVFINREVKAFTLDEAQHLFDVAGGKQINTQMNWLKSIANKTQTVHVLFGTYELLKCQTVNGQVGRRSEDFHLARYHKDKQADREEYKKVITTLQRHLPVSSEPNLEKYADYFMEYSLGCVGILKSWWYRSLKSALDDNAKTVRLKDFKAKALSSGRRNQIETEAINGENNFAALHKLENYDFSGVKPEKSPQKQKPKNVAERNSKRDPVGIQNVEAK
ncbi:MAG: ATP-binding protein [Pleurocapsa sp. MO_192.B19]|nr:ATP-binding protein [Pleurocapsa sp. MO_192.B19]